MPPTYLPLLPTALVGQDEQSVLAELRKQPLLERKEVYHAKRSRQKLEHATAVRGVAEFHGDDHREAPARAQEARGADDERRPGARQPTHAHAIFLHQGGGTLAGDSGELLVPNERGVADDGVEGRREPACQGEEIALQEVLRADSIAPRCRAGGAVHDLIKFDSRDQTPRIAGQVAYAVRGRLQKHAAPKTGIDYTILGRTDRPCDEKACDRRVGVVRPELF